MIISILVYNLICLVYPGFTYRLNRFVLHSLVGMNLAEREKKKNVSELAEAVFVSSSRAAEATSDFNPKTS